MNSSGKSASLNRLAYSWILASLCMLCCLGLSVRSAVAEEVAVIVNPANPIANLSQSELARIFLGRASTFPSGKKAVPVNQSPKSPIRVMFDEKLLGKNPGQMQAYWSQQMFSGDSLPPEELADDAAVLARVAADANAIGYVSASKVSGSVKVVLKQ